MSRRCDLIYGLADGRAVRAINGEAERCRRWDTWFKGHGHCQRLEIISSPIVWEDRRRLKVSQGWIRNAMLAGERVVLLDVLSKVTGMVVVFAGVTGCGVEGRLDCPCTWRSLCHQRADRARIGLSIIWIE
jgi:hypothetical protein